MLALPPQTLSCQIDRRCRHTATQPDRDGVDGVHGDLRSEAKCTGEFLVSAQHGWPGVAAILTEQLSSHSLAVYFTLGGRYFC